MALRIDVDEIWNEFSGRKRLREVGLKEMCNYESNIDQTVTRTPRTIHVMFEYDSIMGYFSCNTIDVIE